MSTPEDGFASASATGNQAGAATGAEGGSERSDRLLKEGAPSRSWAETAARETVRSQRPPAAQQTARIPAGAYASPPPAASAAPQAAAARGGAGARRARLKVAHLNPFSVLRLSLVFAVCMFIVWLVAIAALWSVLDQAGVFSSVLDTATTLTDKAGGGIAPYLAFKRVLGYAALVGAANAVAFVVLSTVGSLLYNLCSDFVGGVEVTLVER